MIYRHLLQLVTHAAAAGRHAAIYSQAAGRAALVALTRVESPRQAFRTARRRIRSARNESRPKQTKRRVAPLLIHYHIFKNAGSSFEFALDQAWRRGLDVKFGLGALIMQVLCMAPLSAFGVMAMFWLLHTRPYALAPAAPTCGREARTAAASTFLASSLRSTNCHTGLWGSRTRPPALTWASMRPARTH